MQCGCVVENGRRAICRLFERRSGDMVPRVRRWQGRQTDSRISDRQCDLLAGGHVDAGRPYLHIQLYRFARDQRPQLIMGMVRLIRQTAGRVGLAMRGTKPALTNRCARILRTLEHDLTTVWREWPKDQEKIGISCRGRYEQLGRRRSGISRGSRKGGGLNVIPSLNGSKAQVALSEWWMLVKGRSRRIEAEAGPLYEQAAIRPPAAAPSSRRDVGY